MVYLLKSKRILLLALVLPLFVFSCKSAPQEETPVVNQPPPPPVVPEAATTAPTAAAPVPRGTAVVVTPFILQRLSEGSYSVLSAYNIQKYQFLLSGGIILEWEDTRASSTDYSGMTILENTRIRERIEIPDRTQGVALNSSIGRNGEISLFVAFDEDDSLQLTFSTLSSDPDAYFFLKYNPNGSMTRGTDRGNLTYGGRNYRLSFTREQKPYLMILLTETERELLESHVAPGRRVGG